MKLRLKRTRKKAEKLLNQFYRSSRKKVKVYMDRFRLEKGEVDVYNFRYIIVVEDLFIHENQIYRYKGCVYPDEYLKHLENAIFARHVATLTKSDEWIPYPTNSIKTIRKEEERL